MKRKCPQKPDADEVTARFAICTNRFMLFDQNIDCCAKLCNMTWMRCKRGFKEDEGDKKEMKEREIIFMDGNLIIISPPKNKLN